MFQNSKIPSLDTYLLEYGISPKDLSIALGEYTTIVDELIKTEISHYEDPLEYIEAKGFLTDIENFNSLL